MSDFAGIESQGFASFEQKWLAANPEARLVAVFLPVASRRRANAFGTLVHELAHTAFHIREAQVATAKLEWWQQELHRSALNQPGHPVTRALFADETARECDPALWPALADGALNLFDQPGAGTLAALIEQLDPFFGAVAGAESALLCDGKGNVESNAALWTLSHLLHSLADLQRAEERLPMPLGLLARHGIARADLAQPSPRRNILIKDFLDELVLETNGALGVASVHSLALRVRTRLDRDRTARALKVTDPLAFLQTHPHAGRWTTLWAAWREARAEKLR
jgi:15-cis-phytoene synthase